MSQLYKCYTEVREKVSAAAHVMNHVVEECGSPRKKMKIVTLPPSYLKFSPENSLVSVWFSSDICFSVFIPLIFNVGGVIKVVLLFLFDVSGVFHTVSWKMSGNVAPATFSVATVLGLMTELSAMVTLAIEGVGVFSDHVLALVSGFVRL